MGQARRPRSPSAWAYGGEALSRRRRARTPEAPGRRKKGRGRRETRPAETSGTPELGVHAEAAPLLTRPEGAAGRAARGAAASERSGSGGPGRLGSGANSSPTLGRDERVYNDCPTADRAPRATPGHHASERQRCRETQPRGRDPTNVIWDWPLPEGSEGPQPSYCRLWTPDVSLDDQKFLFSSDTQNSSFHNLSQYRIPSLLL